MSLNKEIIAGGILLIVWIAMMLILGGNIKPNLNSDNVYETREIGHPLYQ